MPIFNGQPQTPQTIIYDPITGILTDASGNVISGVASYTWAQFTAGAFDTSIARYVHVSDRHSTTDGTSTPGSLWRIDPTAASARKRNLMSGPVYYSTFSSMLTDVPVASWPNHKVVCGDVGNGKIPLFNTGSRYAPIGGRANLVHAVYGTIASPTLTIGAGPTTFTFNIGTPTFPANLFAIGDRLMFKGRGRRHNTNELMFLSVCLGTAGTTSDAALWSANLAATDIFDVPFDVTAMIGSNTAFTTNNTALQGGTGGAGFVTDKSANFNIASVMILTIGGTKNTNDTIDLGGFSLDWIAY